MESCNIVKLEIDWLTYWRLKLRRCHTREQFREAAEELLEDIEAVHYDGRLPASPELKMNNG